MDEPTYSLPIEQPATNKQSGLGIASLSVGILSILGICLAFALSIYSNNVDFQTAQTLTSAVGFGVICSGVISLIGIGLGIAGVLQKGKSKTSAIIGLVLSAVGFIAICGLMMLGVAAMGSF